MEHLISLLGLVVFLGFAYLVSYDRLLIPWKTVAWGLGLQFILAIFILKTPFGLAIFEWLGNTVKTFLDYSDVGAKFVFGETFQEHFIAFKVLPTIIFFASFIAILYHYGILPRVVGMISWIMMRTMKTSGAETLSCASNIFVGCTEAPLMIKPYIKYLTLSELHAIMTGGFATIAGGVMAAYIAMGISPTHLISASVMSAPAALAISKIMYPETNKSETKGEEILEIKSPYTNAIDAATNGALEGLKLSLNVGAMLIAILGLVALINGILGAIGQPLGLSSLSLELIFSYLLAPVAWLMGVPWQDCLQVGILLGKKTILNEFIAYLDLKNLMAENTISPRSQIIATYALCGFSNLGTIGIQIGGISAIAPNRQQDLAKLGLRTMIAGSLACFLTACIAGLLL
ncbi:MULTISPECIES: NupC/NupG family nucleoside CNT transporter [Crocosphaera]|uniref:Nucleoside permease n=3 Tax=Crocosphaera watsonii TaxID=263511 RepID=T2JJT4_CROWT|nr:MULTISPECIES: NupC/NupG family nucleoside CNT transporter [Crocosphaera]EHJ10096.1 sodium-dependent nucleoside transporter [Crocosphaera watsonii WH 0003]MCH2246478.1 NupC/NupG family nucleoside CNT transporter [Crocosphaera sp.]CCQ56972.1 Nucleoside permease NupC [Crocosphaera watsonii WH 0005]CCQ65520.1 sodium-dependent nucleoside transporter [Crocosphaera watsonii WH 0402]